MLFAKFDGVGRLTGSARYSGTSTSQLTTLTEKSISDKNDTARRVYAADGTLLAVYEGTGGTAGRVYVGSLDIVRASNGAFTLESAGWEGGLLLPGTGNDKVLYQITDHLGSVRAIKDGAGNILQRIDYYPFGSVSAGWSSGTTPAQPTIRWRFIGKEIAGQSVGASAPASTPATAVGNPYLDFGARFYDPRTASWLSHDPLSEKYYGISPVVYCAGNPVNFLDSFGEDFYFLYSDGTITFGYYGDEEDDDYLIWGELGEDAYGPMVSIRVSDKNILKSLSQKNKKENLSHSVVSSSSELIDVFDFIVHHSSDREWAIASFRNEEVGIEYGMVQGKRGSSVSSPSDIEGLNERDMIAKIHTHEGYIQDPGASGYVAGSVTTYPTDRSNYDDLSKRLKSQGLRIPKHYVYEVPNGYISQYNSNSGNFNRTKYSLNLLKTYLFK